MNNFVSAIIVSAGNSTRMGTDKQFINICGKPAIIHTIKAFESSSIINEIVIVCKKDHLEDMVDIINKNNIKKVSAITPGGNSRQESVSLGIEKASKLATHFCIHDGARILVTPDIISRVVEKSFEFKCAAVGVPVKDTIKVIDMNGFIESTPNRSSLWAVQTPQVFERKVYMNALENAKKLKQNYTDDCQLVENNGGKVYMLKGDYTNIKLTTIDDIEYAKTMFKNRGVNR